MNNEGKRNLEAITPQQAITRLVDNNELLYDGMTDLMRQIMDGQVVPGQITAILTELRIKVEIVSEITAAAAMMRELVNKASVKDGSGLVDIVGTSGDGAETFNISTAAVFVAAAAGAKAAKYGGRSVSSSSGAIDVMERMGAVLDVTPEQVAESIDKTGTGFMFAPNHHSATRYIAPVCRALGFRSIFGVLGPLINPTDASDQLLGVFHVDLCSILSHVLQQLGSGHVLVVCGEDGPDGIIITGETRVVELRDGTIRECDLNSADYGIEVRRNLGDIKIANGGKFLLKIQGVLGGRRDMARDIVLLNAAAVLYAGNMVPLLAEGVDAAGEAIDSGKAKAKKDEFIASIK